MRRAILLASLLLVALGTASADGDAPLSARSEIRRRYLWIGADGTLAGVAAATTFTVRIRRPQGTDTALAQPVSVPAGGKLHVELRTTQRLLPDLYELEVVSDETTVAKTTFRVGKADEVGPARERLRAWLVNARGTLRDLAAALEQAGIYHRNELALEVQRSGGRPFRALTDAQLAAWRAAIDGSKGGGGFKARYRTARMDYVVYEREVLLSPFPVAGAALSALFPALQDRRGELDAAIEEAAAGRIAPVASATKVLDLAARSAKELGIEPRLEDWGAGELGTPETGVASETGSFTSSLGASFKVPGGWRVPELRLASDDRPEVRFRAFGPDSKSGRHTWVELRIRELPDARQLTDLEAFLEMITWEEMGNNSWKKMGSQRSERFERLDGTCKVDGFDYRLVVVDRAPKAGHRLHELRVFCPLEAWPDHEAEIENLAASFALDPAK